MIKKVENALLEITRGTEEIIDNETIKKLLFNYFKDGTNYLVKAGFDPTAPDLHLGHTVLLQKLSVFQKYGGIVQFLIGDFTAMIGDPTGKNITRKTLSKNEIINNIQSYTKQAFKILDESKTKIVYNSHWLEKLGSIGMLKLTSNLTVARMLERDDFSKRYSSNMPIALSEFIYPLLQGYDSVHLKSDIELGGTDQKFNLLMGRQLQKVYNTNKQQSILMMPILEGLDGIQKMSKSLNNYIGVTEEASEMYGKILSISDDLMWRYYELLSSKTIEEIKGLKNGCDDKSLHPKKVKDMLAIEIVDRFNGIGSGQVASEKFTEIFSKKNVPTNLEEFSVEIGSNILNVLVQCKLEPSISQAKRDLKAGAIKINQIKVKDEKFNFVVGSFVLQKGKKFFVKVTCK